MAEDHRDAAAEGHAGPPPGGYPPSQPNYPPPPPSAGWSAGNYPPPPERYPAAQYPQYPPAGQYPPTAPQKKRSVGKRILIALVVFVVLLAVRVGFRMAFHQGSHTIDSSQHSSNGFDYAVGTCLDLSKASIMISPSDVKVLPCSSPAALAKVAKKYQGAKNCPTDKYATLDSGGNGLCLQENLTTGSCYQQNMLSHMFASSDCTPGLVDPTFKVALRQDGVDNPGLCTSDQQALDYPDPPLTYCLDVFQPSRLTPTQ